MLRQVNGPEPFRRPDEELIAEFGHPTFELVTSHYWRLLGWEHKAVDGSIYSVGAGYEAIDPHSNRNHVHAEVFTEVPGVVSWDDRTEERGALAHHLFDAVIESRFDNLPEVPLARSNVEIDPVQIREKVFQLKPVAQELRANGAEYSAESAVFDGHTAVTTKIQNRLVTLVLRHVEFREDRIVLISRP